MDENFDFDARRAWETIEHLTREVDALQLAVNAAHVRIKEYEMEKEAIEDRIAHQQLDLLVQSDRAQELRAKMAEAYRRGFADTNGDGGSDDSERAARVAARLHLLDRMINAGNVGDVREVAEVLARAERWLASDPEDAAIREVRDRLRDLAPRGA